jgi:2',3'-cyclic-nucleotide 2'-phosphodiesterase (5'-nucleotidase family)
MKWIYGICMFLLLFGSAVEGADQEISFWLTVLHNDDAESQLIHAGPGLEDFGGVARFATIAAELKRAAIRRLEERTRQGVILLSAGDNIFPGAVFNASLAKGIPFYETIAMERIGYDASGVSNHDFDLGPDILANFIEGFSSLPFVSANLRFKKEPNLQALVQADRLLRSVVLEVSGEKIGVIGITTPRLPIISSSRNVTVRSDLAKVVTTRVERLREQDVGIIILMTQLESLAEDQELLGHLRAIDIVISSGSERSNELQANPGDLLIPGDVPFAPYPLYVRDADGKKVPVVSTTGQYRYIGQLRAGFNKHGKLIRVDGTRSHPFRVAGGNHPDAVEPDPVLRRRVVEPVQAALNALAAHVIAANEISLDGLETHVRTIETNEGNLVADAFFAEAARLAPVFGMQAPDLAIANGGGIRNNSVIPPGHISELDTFEIVPFPNVLAIVPDISATQLKEILENAVSQVEILDGRFAQVAGCHFTWDPSSTAQQLDSNGNVVTPGTRIREVVLNDGTAIVSGGSIVTGARSVTIALTNFLAAGGDEYPFRGADFANLGITSQQALFNYIVNTLDGVISAADYPVNGEGRIIRQ